MTDWINLRKNKKEIYIIQILRLQQDLLWMTELIPKDTADEYT